MAEPKKSQWLPVAVVRSKSNSEKSYQISLSRSGKFGCACPAFIYQRGPAAERKDCVHIRENADVLQELAVAAVQHELRAAAQTELFSLAAEEERALAEISGAFTSGTIQGLMPATPREELVALREAGLRIILTIKGRFVVQNRAGVVVASAKTQREAIDAAQYALKG